VRIARRMGIVEDKYHLALRAIELSICPSRMTTVGSKESTSA
jgi:hypothetical protein